MMGSNNGRPAAPENGGVSCEVTSPEHRHGGEFVQRLDDDGHFNKQGFDQSHCTAMLNIIVCHGSNLHNLSVPSDSTFVLDDFGHIDALASLSVLHDKPLRLSLGDLKRTFAQEILIKPQMQKLFFRGKEKDDSEQLQMAGVKDHAKVVLLEDTSKKETSSGQTNPTGELSRGVAAVAGVRAEVDKLWEKVSTLQSVVQNGTQIDEKEIVYITEMLMRQLLKLDSIEAEGDGKIQRKMEVRRVQNFVETMDSLKAMNSNPFNNFTNSAAVPTEWEKFDSSVGNIGASTVVPPPKVTQEWERFD